MDRQFARETVLLGCNAGIDAGLLWIVRDATQSSTERIDDDPLESIGHFVFSQDYRPSVMGRPRSTVYVKVFERERHWRWEFVNEDDGINVLNPHHFTSQAEAAGDAYLHHLRVPVRFSANGDGAASPGSSSPASSSPSSTSSG